MAKLNVKKLKAEFDELEEDDKKSIREALGVTGDDDVISTLKKLGERLDILEKGSKEKVVKKDGFFASIFE